MIPSLPPSPRCCLTAKIRGRPPDGASALMGPVPFYLSSVFLLLSFFPLPLSFPQLFFLFPSSPFPPLFSFFPSLVPPPLFSFFPLFSSPPAPFSFFSLLLPLAVWRGFLPPLPPTAEAASLSPAKREVKREARKRGRGVQENQTSLRSLVLSLVVWGSKLLPGSVLVKGEVVS